MAKNKFLSVFFPIQSIIMLTVGWLGKDLQINGVSGAAEPIMVGGLGAAGVGLLVWKMYMAWKLGGGKLDGIVTPKEIKDPADVLLDKVAPQLKEIVNQLAEPISNLVNTFLSHSTPTITVSESAPISSVPPTAATLIDLLSKWDNDPTKDAVDSPLYHQMLDMLTRVVSTKIALPNQENPAEQLRKLLHQTTAVPSSDAK